jgi:hypothetical protein
VEEKAGRQALVDFSLSMIWFKKKDDFFCRYIRNALAMTLFMQIWKNGAARLQNQVPEYQKAASMRRLERHPRSLFRHKGSRPVIHPRPTHWPNIIRRFRNGYPKIP